VSTLLRRRWTSSFEGMSRRDRQGCDYDVYLPDPLAGWDLAIPADLVADLTDAEAAIRQLNTSTTSHVSLEGLARFLLRAESVASSKIEGLEAGPRRLLDAEIVLALGGHAADRIAVEVLANVAAMEAAVELGSTRDTITLDDLLGIHRILMERFSTPHIGGVVRTVQNWIGGSGYNPCSAVFVPPPPESLDALLHDLLDYVNGDDHPALVQAAIAHAQFETIHPFPDGNGRVGRALVHALLKAGGLARSVTVPVSAGLLGDTGTYFTALTAYRAGDPEPIVKVMAEATFPAIGNGRRLAADLRATRARWSDLITARRGAGAHLLADLLIQHPVIDMPLVARELSLATSNAQHAIDRLVGDGVLRLIGKGARDRVWEAPEVISALEEFAKRAKRRTV
jgi:Fic family protein